MAKLQEMKLQNEFGDVLTAYAAIFEIDFSTHRRSVAESFGDDYVKTVDSGCTCKIWYYSSKEKFEAGFPERALLQKIETPGEDGIQYTDIITIDTEHVNAKAIINSALSDDEKEQRIIKDYLARTAV